MIKTLGYLVIGLFLNSFHVEATEENDLYSFDAPSISRPAKIVYHKLPVDPRIKAKEEEREIVKIIDNQKVIYHRPPADYVFRREDNLWLADAKDHSSDVRLLDDDVRFVTDESDPQIDWDNINLPKHPSDPSYFPMEDEPSQQIESRSLQDDLVTTPKYVDQESKTDIRESPFAELLSVNAMQRKKNKPRRYKSYGMYGNRRRQAISRSSVGQFTSGSKRQSSPNAPSTPSANQEYFEDDERNIVKQVDLSNDPLELAFNRLRINLHKPPVTGIYIARIDALKEAAKRVMLLQRQVPLNEPFYVNMKFDELSTDQILELENQKTEYWLNLLNSHVSNLPSYERKQERAKIIDDTVAFLDRYWRN